jgi:hypothetical protein
MINPDKWRIKCMKYNNIPLHFSFSLHLASRGMCIGITSANFCSWGTYLTKTWEMRMMKSLRSSSQSCSVGRNLSKHKVCMLAIGLSLGRSENN